MARKKKSKSTCRSVEEFRQKYYPKAATDNWLETDDPEVLARNLVHQSAKAIQNRLCPRAQCV